MADSVAPNCSLARVAPILDDQSSSGGTSPAPLIFLNPGYTELVLYGGVMENDGSVTITYTGAVTNTLDYTDSWTVTFGTPAFFVDLTHGQCLVEFAVAGAYTLTYTASNSGGTTHADVHITVTNE